MNGNEWKWWFWHALAIEIVIRYPSCRCSLQFYNGYIMIYPWWSWTKCFLIRKLCIDLMDIHTKSVRTIHTPPGHPCVSANQPMDVHVVWIAMNTVSVTNHIAAPLNQWTHRSLAVWLSWSPIFNRNRKSPKNATTMDQIRKPINRTCPVKPERPLAKSSWSELHFPVKDWKSLGSYRWKWMCLHQNCGRLTSLSTKTCWFQHEKTCFCSMTFSCQPASWDRLDCQLQTTKHIYFVHWGLWPAHPFSDQRKRPDS
jgi:hypothetical protein